MTSRTSRWSAVAAGSAATLLVTACGGGGTATDPASAADGPTVIAAFYPLEWAAARISGDLATVSTLTPPGAEAHDIELTPQDVGSLSEADVVFYVEGFQPAVDSAVEAEAGDAAWEAGRAADLTLTTDDHGHEDEDGEAPEEEAHSDEQAAVDPHFWLDPTRLASVGDALAERLGELAPDDAAAFEENAASLRADLEELDAEMEEALSNCEVSTLVTSHDAFGYLGDRYGLDVVGISGLEPSEETSPAELAEIAELVEERGVTTIYTETLIDPAVAETVAAEAGVRTAVLDPLEGLTDESAGEDYLEVMRANLEALEQGLACT